jgi:putative FmdB family regulatory protein
MPIYEYRCKSCDHHLEALQKVSDGPLRKCPECGKLSLKKLVSAAAFRLKGGGWYETDFKSDGEKKRNLVDSGDGAGESKSSNGDSGGKEKSTASAKSKETKSTAKAKSKPASKKAAVNG